MFLNNNKKLLSLLFIVIAVFVVFGATPTTTMAQSVTSETPLGYEPLQNLPGINSEADFTLADYLNAMFRIFLGIASILAVLKIVIAGVKYGTSDSESGTKEAKDMMTSALWGLMLALGAWLILYTINPKLLEFKLDLEPIEGTKVSTTPNQGQSWPDDSSIRSVLANSGILVNKNNCSYVGETNCTSVVGVSASTVAKLRNLANDCNCTITITGGTEHWLHQTHGPGNILDLRVSAGLTSYINPDNEPLGCYDKIQHADGNTYQWEPPGCGNSTGAHWHVIF